MDITHFYLTHLHSFAECNTYRISDCRHIHHWFLYSFGNSSFSWSWTSELWNFKLNQQIFTFANLCDIRITIRCRLDWDSHSVRGVLAFDQKIIRIKKFAMMANIKFFKRFSDLERIMASFLDLFKHIFVLILAWFISPEMDFPES